MALTKKAQWIVWDGRKHGIDAETIIARCEEKGCEDTREDLMKAITSRPYKAQPARTYSASRAHANLFDSLKAQIEQVTDGQLKEELTIALEAKIAEHVQKAEQEKQQSLIANIEQALANL